MTAPLPDDRGMAAIEVLRRIYEGVSDEPLMDSSMMEEWIDNEIMVFIRKFGPFPTPFGRALRKFGTEVEADRPRAEAEFRRQLYGG